MHRKQQTLTTPYKLELHHQARTDVHPLEDQSHPGREPRPPVEHGAMGLGNSGDQGPIFPHSVCKDLVHA